MIALLSPESFVAALELLRVDIEHNDVALSDTESLGRALRCAGLDVYAGQMVAHAVRAGTLTSWTLVDLFVGLVRERVEHHPCQQEQAPLLLLLTPFASASQLRGHEHMGAALEDLIEWAQEKWGSELLVLLVGVYSLVMWIVHDEHHGASVLDVDVADIHTRDLVRAAFDFGGLDAARALVEGLQARLQEVQP